MTVGAAGGVLWRATVTGPEVVVVHRPRHGDWTLPKGKAVACSQGGVIPYVVESLCRADGLAPLGVRADKGSTWVLSFAGGRLVAAHYLDAP